MSARGNNADQPEPTDADYELLLELRTGIRLFLHWSEEQAARAGLTAAQHQLLLAIRGHADPRGPTIGDVANSLLLRHHSAVGLVDRAEAAGLVARRADEGDQRVVRLRLTPAGSRRIRQLSALHLEELTRLAPRFRALWSGLETTNS
jgi:DNA-binding MarR family transcriptional regulator